MSTEPSDNQSAPLTMTALAAALNTAARMAIDSQSATLTMTTEELARELRMDERSIRRWDKTGKLPKPIRLGESAKRWSRDVIQRWLAAVKPDGTLPNRREWEAMEEQRIRNEIARR